jgi:hypothetical protein
MMKNWRKKFPNIKVFRLLATWLLLTTYAQINMGRNGLKIDFMIKGKQ